MERIFSFACSLDVQFSISSIAFSLAPPCKGPLNEPIAATTHEWMSDIVEAQTLPVNVDALNSCSAYKTRDTSITFL